jgi:cell division septation protein DedD
MQALDSGSCRPSGCGSNETAATQASKASRGSFQDRADQLVRSTVLADLARSFGGHGSGIQGIAAAVRKVLSKSDVAGTDVPDDVLKKIEASLKKAAQALADRGVDAKTIDATIDKFRAQLANALDKVGGTAAETATSVDKFVAREVRKQRGAIDLVTAEGDKVSIRFRTKEVVTGSVTETTAADGTKTTETKASVFSRGGVKIEVDGDLNEEELAAIGELLGKVDEIATKFFSGDVQAAFTAATSVGIDSDQIASYQLNLTYSRKIAAAYSHSGASLPAPAPTTQPPASSSTSTTPVTDSSSSASTPSDASPSGTPATTTSTANGSTSSGAGAGDGAASTDAPPATTPPASAQKTIIDFIGDVLSKLGSVEGTGRASFSMQWKVKVLVTALESLQPATPTTPAEDSAAQNTELLGDALQKAATA